MQIKLIHSKTGRVFSEGETVQTMRGETGTLETIRPDEGRNGKVYVRIAGKSFTQCFYPSVIGCEFSSGEVEMLDGVPYVKPAAWYDEQAEMERAGRQ